MGDLGPSGDWVYLMPGLNIVERSDFKCLSSWWWICISTACVKGGNSRVCACYWGCSDFSNAVARNPRRSWRGLNRALLVGGIGSWTLELLDWAKDLHLRLLKLTPCIINLSVSCVTGFPPILFPSQAGVSRQRWFSTSVTTTHQRWRDTVQVRSISKTNTTLKTSAKAISHCRHIRSLAPCCLGKGTGRFISDIWHECW